MSQYIDQSDLLLSVNRPKEAIQLLLKLLAEQPNHARAYANLARCSLMLERSYDAALQIQEAIRIAPDDAYPHYIHSFVLRDLERHKEARTAIQEALRLVPDRPSYLAQSCHLWNAEEQFENAIRDAKLCLELQPDHVECACHMAFALMRQERLAESEKFLQSILVHKPDHARVHATYGWVAVSQHRYRFAEECFLQALRIEPEYVWAQTGLQKSLPNNFVWRFFVTCEEIAPDSLGACPLLLMGFVFVYACSWMTPWLPEKNHSSPSVATYLGYFLAFPAIITCGLSALVGKPLSDGRRVISKYARSMMSRGDFIATIIAWSFVLVAAATMAISGGLRDRTAYAFGCILFWSTAPVASIWRFRLPFSRITFVIASIVYFATAITYAKAGTLTEDAWGHWMVALSLPLLVWLAKAVEPEQNR